MAKKPPQQANNYIQQLEEQRRRQDMTREQVNIRLVVDRIDKMTENLLDGLDDRIKQTMGTDKAVPKAALGAFKKALEDTLGQAAGSRSSLKAASDTLADINKQIESSTDLFDEEIKYLKEYSKQVELEISKRQSSWLKGMAGLSKSFKGLDTDMKSLLVGATAKSPLLMIATKLYYNAKEQREKERKEAASTGLDTRITLAKSREEAKKEVEQWVNDWMGDVRKAIKEEEKLAKEANKNNAPASPKATKGSSTNPAPTTPTPQKTTAAPVPVDPALVLLDKDEVTDRDRARDFAIEQWLQKNPGKDLDESPFARQDKVWAKPRQVNADDVQVTDEPVKESIDKLTTVVEGQSEPIRESLHEDKETNDLMRMVLASGEQLASDMKMQEEERAREQKAPLNAGQRILNGVAPAKEKGSLWSALGGLSGILTAMGGMTGILAALGGLSGIMTAIGGAAAIVAALGIGYVIGEGIEALSKHFFGISLKQETAKIFGQFMGHDKAAAEQATESTVRAQMNRLEALGYRGTLEQMSAAYARDNFKKQQAGTAPSSAAPSASPSAVNSTPAPLSQTGYVSGYGQVVTADTTFGSDTPVGLAPSVPMHASSPQVVAQGAMGNGALKTADQWTMSAAGLAALKRREGFRSKPYKDGNSGRLAIGYGFQEWKGRRVEDWLAENPNFKVSQAEADAELVRRINEDFKYRVHKDIGNTPLTQSQFDALASIAFNAGHVPNNIERKIRNGEPLTRADFERTGTERIVENGKFVGSRANKHLMERRVGEFEQFNAPATVATIAPRVAMTGQLSMASQNRSQQPVVISAPIVHAPQTTMAAAAPAGPTVMVLPNARNPEPSLNALTRLQTGG